MFSRIGNILLLVLTGMTTSENSRNIWRQCLVHQFSTDLWTPSQLSLQRFSVLQTAEVAGQVHCPLPLRLRQCTSKFFLIRSSHFLKTKMLFCQQNQTRKSKLNIHNFIFFKQFIKHKSCLSCARYWLTCCIHSNAFNVHSNPLRYVPLYFPISQTQQKLRLREKVSDLPQVSQLIVWTRPGFEPKHLVLRHLPIAFTHCVTYQEVLE